MLLAIAVDLFDGLTCNSRAADKGKLGAGRSPGGLEFISFASRPLFERAAGEIRRPDVVTALECPIGGKGYFGSVRGEAGLAIVSMPAGDLANAATVRLHRPDVECSPRIGLERDEITLRRPAWMGSFGNRVGELRSLAATDGQRPEKPLQVHDDCLMVGRDGHGEIRAFMNRNPFRLS